MISKENAPDSIELTEGGKTTKIQYNSIITKPEQGLCSGYGQWHSPNNEKDPQSYTSITLSDIERMAQHPISTEKKRAQWVVLSTMLSRVHAEQCENGQFVGILVDIDEPGNLTFGDILDRVESILPAYIAYTTKGATQDRQKCRIIAPLDSPVRGADFILLQKIFNDKLQAAGITPDRATERAGQICYLPNRGEFYEHVIKDGPRLDASIWAADVAEEQQRIEAEKQTQKERKEQAKVKATQRMVSGCESPIDAFNAEYDLPMMLDAFGYVKRGNRWLSPNSESGVPGVTITDDGRKWLSAHGSDAGIGSHTSNGTIGDAFDLFAYYQHGGDRDQAIKAAAKMFGCSPAKDKKVDLSSRNTAENKATKKVKKNRRLTFAPASELTGFQESAEWIVKGHIEAGNLVTFFAQPASLKTFVVIDLGLCVATGKDWHGHKVKAGPVLYVCGEGRRGIGRRLQAWEINHGTKATNFFVSSTSAQLLEQSSLEELEAAADEVAENYGSPALVIIDTLNRNFGPGDENSTTDMTRFIAALDHLRERLQCAIAVVHHTGLADTGRGRGSSALNGAIDFEYKITRNKGATVEDRTIELVCSKAKDHDEPQTIAFKPVVVNLGFVDEDGKPVTSLALEQTEVKKKGQACKMAPAQRTALKALVAVIGEDGRAYEDDWRQEAYRAGISTKDTPNSKRQAFNRARAILVDSGEIETRDDFYWLPLQTVTNRDNVTQGNGG